MPFEHWAGHIPFAFWLTRILRPRQLVELGTHRGNSYCAFLQAMAHSGIAGQCHAVDTWQGDLHMAQETGLFEELSAYHDPRYGGFSTLLRMDFAQARPLFGAGSIDLLHIDGCHTYDAVRQDFELWAPTLSDRGVVLFHDTNVRRPDYGVWQLWAELKDRHPHFEFVHSYGLGVLALGSELPAPLRRLLAASAEPAREAGIRALFAARGRGVTFRLQAEQHQAEALRLLGEAGAAQQQAAAAQQRQAEAQQRQAEAEAALGTAETAAETLAQQLRQQLRHAQAAAQQMQTTALQAHDAALGREAAAVAAARQEAAGLQVRLGALEEELRQMRDSTFWRMTGPLRSAAGLLPQPARRLGRGGAKLLRWSLTLQLRRRLRERRALLNSAATMALPAPEAPPASLSPPSLSPGSLPPASPPAGLTPARPALTGRMPAADEVAGMAWPDTFRLRGHQPAARIAVVLHLFYPELWEEFETALGALDEPFDLFVTLVQGHSEALQETILARYPAAVVLAFPNHGRDVYPFIALVNSGALFGYELICKLHSKRSLHRQDGDAWRRSLTAGLLRDRGHVRDILGAFRGDPDLGVVVARGNVVGQDPEHWHSNLTHVHRLSERMGIPPLNEPRTFPGGSVYWIRPFLLRPIASARMTPGDFEAEPLPHDGTAAHAVERLIGLLCHDAGMRIAEEQEVAAPAIPAPAAKVDIVAFYLPQFHPIPENDRWWGAGFTEWSNATRAKPQFPGHRQPRLPGALGFYDLRLPQTRAAQAALARQHGVSAFCYYHYWFDGQPLLETPIQAMLASGEPDFPFMICWANEPWTRNWDGLARDILMPQSYQPGWEAAFARDIAPLLRDRRYWRQGGRPMLLIYRVMHMPRPVESMAALRQALREEGVGEVHLAAGWVAFTDDAALPEDPAALGLDSYFEFPPHRLSGAREVTAERLAEGSGFQGQIYDYGSVVEGALAGLAAPVQGVRHRAATMGWDNTARRGARASILHGATPASFRRWLRGLVRDAAARPPAPGEAGEGRLVFVNAWNEWAEGTTLEPDQDFGSGWLEAVSSALPQPPPRD
ncbi:glycoside hydrolase family 99-like domain-containing protein [Teichococcus deserti]|uniref:glycoside hydrolase family 99-like domain-containing protein n=1 Tax=Teichococcus deserti TaxID=1817963 RepID=UPI0013F62D7B|nr:glycoside hydrolase family 99-like domain-containing protein [Pseudoroseomonas deserti]